MINIFNLTKINNGNQIFNLKVFVFCLLIIVDCLILLYIVIVMVLHNLLITFKNDETVKGGEREFIIKYVEKGTIL